MAAPFSFGNAGRNSATGIGINRLDFSLVKNIRLAGDRWRQLRLEAFNLFHTPDFFQTSTVFGWPQSGTITQAYDGRDIPFGAWVPF